MAGLLDLLNSDDAKLGLSLLAASGPSYQPVNAAQRIAGAFDSFRQAKAADEKNALQARLLDSQIAENASQAEYRKSQAEAMKRAQDLDAQWIGGGFAPAGMSPGQGADAGKFYPTPAPMGPMADGGMPQAAASGPSNRLQAISQQYGVPLDALTADYIKNGGKGIADLIVKYAQPKWENVNGNLVNVNAPGFKGGLQAGMATSASGQVTAWQPDGNGGVVVGAPRGALETYGAYKGVDAGYTPMQVYNPQSGRMEFTTQANVVGAASPQRAPSAPAAGPGYAGGSAASAAPEQLRILQSELTAEQQKYAQAGKDGNLQAQAAAKANIEGLQREMGRLQLGGVPQGAGAGRGSVNPPMASFAAGPSAQEQTREAVEREAALSRQKDIGEQRKSIMNSGFVAPGNIARYQQIGKLLEDVDGGKLTEAGTEFASALNSVGIKVDKNLSNKEAAASFANQAALELRNPSGGAGMPGAMSDSDRNFLAAMTPNMSQSAEGRRLIINSYVAIQQRNAQVADFARKYETKYGKLDNGFFDQLQQWSNANPLFKTK